MGCPKEILKAKGIKGRNRSRHEVLHVTIITARMVVQGVLAGISTGALNVGLSTPRRSARDDGTARPLGWTGPRWPKPEIGLLDRAIRGLKPSPSF